MPQGSVLGPLLFLIYINDLHSCLKYSKAYHFADDTNVTLSDCSQETLTKGMNHDLRKLSMWLRANKLSLNIEKTELVVFRRQNTKLNNSFKIQIDGKFPTSSVKYLGVLLDKHLTWSPQMSHVQMKLNGAIRILSKLRYQASIHVPKTVYDTLFGTHLLYPSQLWGKNKKETQNKFRTLQNKALKQSTVYKTVRERSVMFDFSIIIIFIYHYYYYYY